MKRHLDLFAGTGGFSLAVRDHYQTVFANDCEPSSKKIYDLNHPIPLTLGSLLDLSPSDLPSHDLLTAGFPCQPFSVAGHRQGFNDPRSHVFWKLVEILKVHQPEALLLENVKNLVSHDQGRTFATITTALTELGYHLHHRVINTCKLTSIPQNRERIYLVGFRDRARYDRFVFPDEVIKTNPLSSLLESSVDPKYYYSSRYACWDMVEKEVVNPNVVYQMRRHYVRTNKSGVCPTLTANMGSGGHNVPLIRDSHGIRKLTPRECFRLQGFDDDYRFPSGMSDSALYKLAGNAITVDVARRAVKAMVE